ncbi:hypothetical protein [Paenibacillus sp. GYB003]
MKRADIIALIQNELKENPHAASIEIAKKHRIPVTMVEVFRRKLAKNS